MKILAIAKNTYKEAVRSKLFLLLTLFSIAFILFSKVVSLLVISSGEKIIIDLGFAIIEIFAVLLSILISVNLFYKERDKRTIFNILSKPISREEFIIGKFLGLSFTLFVSILILGIVFIGYSLIVLGKLSLYVFPQLFLFFMEGEILISFSLLFTSVSTPILSSIFSAGIYIVGNFSSNFLLYYEAKVKGLAKLLVNIVYYILPNFSILNYKNQLVYTKGMDLGNFVNASVYGIDYALLILVLSMIAFKNREIL